ncbi:MAG: hypothetical protein UX25_C0022G0001, partial [Candidatus Woesebacteria bacterium GW2011_GWC2_45_9]
MSAIKKIVLSFFVFLLLTFSFVPYAQAQGAWYNQSFEEWSTKVFDKNSPQEIFGERYTYAQVLWIVYSLTSVLTGPDLLACLNSADSGETLKNCIEALNPQGGSLGNSANIAFWGDTLLTSRPASGVEYLANAASRLNIIPQAYAQEGFGFRTLQPVLTIWKIVRNMTYLLLVLVILVLAFMIMFRVKISPQVVITVQSALPKIAITIVLITFSYAIAGFLVDISYLILGVIAAFIKSAGSEITSLGFKELYNTMLTGHPIAAIMFALTIFTLIIAGTAGWATAIPILTVPGFIVGGLAIVLFLLIMLLLVIAAVRIIWLMFKTFVTIVLLIIAGPIMILLGAVSPSFGGFGQWVRTLLSHIAVYPTIILMMFLAHFFFWGFFTSSGLGLILKGFEWLASDGIFSQWLAATSSSVAFPGFSFATAGIFGFVLSFGIILLTPNVGNIIQSLIQGKPFPYGTAIGEAFGPAKYGAMAYGYRVAGALTEEQVLPPELRRIQGIIPEGWRRPAGKALETFLTFFSIFSFILQPT